MKNSFAVLTLGALLSSSIASAALAPWGERAVELAAVVQSPVVEATTGTLSIDSVRWIANDKYEVTAGSCIVEVALESIPPPPHIIGARRFKILLANATGCPVSR